MLHFKGPARNAPLPTSAHSQARSSVATQSASSNSEALEGMKGCRSMPQMRKVSRDQIWTVTAVLGGVVDAHGALSDNSLLACRNVAYELINAEAQ